MAKRGRPPGKNKNKLPDKPPKKTGKRGPRLEEPDKKAASAGDDTQTEQSQGELLVEQPPQPTVVKGRILANFLKPIFSKAPKSGDRLISLQMVVMLTKEHDDDKVIPDAVRDAWHIIAKRHRKRMDFDVPGQTVKFHMAHDDDEVQITLLAAKVTNCSVAVIQKKGEGEAVKIIRWSWRYQVSWDKDTERFAASNYGAGYWITTCNTEEKLWDEEAEE